MNVTRRVSVALVGVIAIGVAVSRALPKIGVGRYVETAYSTFATSPWANDGVFQEPEVTGGALYPASRVVDRGRLLVPFAASGTSPKSVRFFVAFRDVGEIPRDAEQIGNLRAKPLAISGADASETRAFGARASSDGLIELDTTWRPFSYLDAVLGFGGVIAIVLQIPRRVNLTLGSLARWP